MSLVQSLPKEPNSLNRRESLIKEYFVFSKASREKFVGAFLIINDLAYWENTFWGTKIPNFYFVWIFSTKSRSISIVCVVRDRTTDFEFLPGHPQLV